MYLRQLVKRKIGKKVKYGFTDLNLWRKRYEEYNGMIFVRQLNKPITEEMYRNLLKNIYANLGKPFNEKI